MVEYNPKVEVSGGTILGFINCMRKGKEKRTIMLEKHGITNPQVDEWYSYQKLIDAQKEIGETVGEMNLFLIGSKTAETARLPPIANLEEALKLMNIGYLMSHCLNGKTMFNPEDGTFTEGIGSYHLEEYSAESRSATVVCRNPYSSKMQEGVLLGMVRRFKPIDSEFQEVKLDLNKETRTTGGDSCTYLLNW